MAKLTEAVSAVTPLGDALREPVKAPRKRRESTVPEPLDVAWSCPCHGARFDDLRVIYLHIRAELQARDDARDSLGRRRIAKCGTNGGFRAHHSRGEKPCEICRDASRAAARAWRADNRDAANAADRARRAVDRDAYNARARSRAAANREQINASAAVYRAANRQKINTQQNARRAARRAAQQQDVA